MQAAGVRPTYTIQVDAKRGYLALSVTGIWTEVTFEEFDRDLDRERDRMKKAGLSPNWPRVLIDTSGFGVQPQTVAARLIGRVERFHADRRLAFVAPEGQLAKIQLRRIAAIEEHQFFDSPEAARAWLFGNPAGGKKTGSMVTNRPGVSSVLMGASRPEQVQETSHCSPSGYRPIGSSGSMP